MYITVTCFSFWYCCLHILRSAFAQIMLSVCRCLSVVSFFYSSNKIRILQGFDVVECDVIHKVVAHDILTLYMLIPLSLPLFFSFFYLVIGRTV